MKRSIRTALLLAIVSLSSHRALQAQVARYRVTSTAVLTLDRVNEPPLVDTLTTSALLFITIPAAAPVAATLAIDSLQLTSTGMVRRAPDAFARGTSLSAALTDGRPRITGDSATACTAERPMAALLPELLPLLPTPLRADQQWSDTLTVTTCRASLPVTTVSIVSFRTLTGMDSTTVLLERRAVMRATGSIAIRDQLVTLSGSGTSESLSTVLVATRQIQSHRGSQSLDFSLTNGQQTRRMVQQITDAIAILP